MSKFLKSDLKKYKLKDGEKPNYIFMNGGKYLIPKNEEVQFLKRIFIDFCRNELDCPLIPVIKKDSTDIKNYRLFFDIDENPNNMEEVIKNIGGVLKDCFSDIDTDSYYVTHRKNDIFKYHLYYTNIFIKNEYQLLLNFLINDRFGEKYVDILKSSQGLRVPMCRKFIKAIPQKKVWDGSFEDGSEYVLKDGVEITEEMFINELNIRIEGDLVKPKDCVHEYLKSKAFLDFLPKKKNDSKNKEKMNVDLEVNKEITEAIRGKYDIIRDYNKGNVIFYHINKDCPYIKRRHKSNNTKIEYHIDTSMVYLTCCDDECTKNNPRIDITNDILPKSLLIDDEIDLQCY